MFYNIWRMKRRSWSSQESFNCTEELYFLPLWHCLVVRKLKCGFLSPQVHYVNSIMHMVESRRSFSNWLPFISKHTIWYIFWKSIACKCAFRSFCSHLFTAVLGMPQSSIDLSLCSCFEDSLSLNIVLIDVIEKKSFFKVKTASRRK